VIVMVYAAVLVLGSLALVGWAGRGIVGLFRNRG
jgi:hypothetical protein